jgi:hypothetical protein
MVNVIARNLTMRDLVRVAPPTGAYHNWHGFCFFVRQFAGIACVAVANYAQATQGTFDLVSISSL